MNNFKLEDWLPQEPAKGPPLPRLLNILWPWYREIPPEVPPEVPPGVPPEVPPLAYRCPYCDQSFATLKELIAHAATVHPEKPPLQEITIEWE